MARHSHWAQIKLKKGATDKKRGKIFSKHARLIEVSARSGGGDPNMNAALRLAMENARADNMPKENIERAIKKGTGELKEGEQMQEVTYEGYGPGGIALVIDALTDNKNRTNQTIRMILQKHGGHLGSTGATSFLFELKGVLQVQGNESDELEIIDAGAEDIEKDNDVIFVYTKPNELGLVKKKLEEKGFKIISAQLEKMAKNSIKITDPKIIEKIETFLEALDEEDDVVNVAVNYSVSSLSSGSSG
ncbi:YebC/PmpR family DNA-binding transcriptional regulator [Candidatus Peregrinibacteria bacterium]|nr:YebC/PmpR family DNA-binding transcriptional regulator [Candidatus Peregrinibacteria bacterium]